jgi:hypothetical protein
MNCEFTNPVDLGNGDFEYSKMNCDLGDLFTLVKNETYPERFFYVQNTINYGEAIIIWFLTIFSIFFITKIIFNFFWSKK